jgi:surfactin synthase thioesterase subunit
MLCQAVELLKYVDVDALPLSVYGHSHGAFAALELAIQLKQELSFRVHRLVIGGSRAPHVRLFEHYTSFSSPFPSPT